MPDLIAPTARLHAAWLEAHDEWGPGLHEDGFGLLPSDEVDSPPGFAAWVARLAADESDPANAVEAGRARVLGLDRVLILCEVDNVASVKTIERHGGVLEDIRDTEHGAVRRYWIKIK